MRTFRVYNDKHGYYCDNSELLKTMGKVEKKNQIGGKSNAIKKIQTKTKNDLKTILNAWNEQQVKLKVFPNCIWERAQK